MQLIHCKQPATFDVEINSLTLIIVVDIFALCWVCFFRVFSFSAKAEAEAPEDIYSPKAPPAFWVSSLTFVEEALLAALSRGGLTKATC